MNATDVPIIHMTEGNALVRVPANRRGQCFSVISLGGCNMSCPYCFLGGNLPRNGSRFPNIYLEKEENIFLFIKSQVEKGNPVKLSGGEPTLFLPLAEKILRYTKELGGYVCLDTNGWNFERAFRLLKYVDQLAVDIKGPPRYVERLTGVSLDLSYDNPIRILKVAAEYVETVEARSMVFGFTTVEDLTLIADQLPESVYWNLRSFVVDWTPYDANHTSSLGGAGHTGNRGLHEYEPWLTVKSTEDFEEIVKQIVEMRPELSGRLIALSSSPRFSSGTKILNCGNSMGRLA